MPECSLVVVVVVVVGRLELWGCSPASTGEETLTFLLGGGRILGSTSCCLRALSGA